MLLFLQPLVHNLSLSPSRPVFSTTECPYLMESIINLNTATSQQQTTNDKDYLPDTKYLSRGRSS